jgi:flagellar hook protein FlgE
MANTSIAGPRWLRRTAVTLALLVFGIATPEKAFPQGSLTNITLSPVTAISLTNFSASNIVAATGFPISGMLKINGPGYFVVRDPVSGRVSATRFGPFTADMNGYLVTDLGAKVQGYADPSLTVIGDVCLYNAVGPQTNGSPYLCSYAIETNGCIMETFSDGSSRVGGQILLQTFQNPSALIAEGWLEFGWSASAGPLPQPVPPGTSGTGSLLLGALEQLTPSLQLSRYTGPPQAFSQGVLVSTGLPTDIGIEGGGFFVLRRTNDNALFATRAGAFYIDGSGYLVHYSGMRLQGYADSTLTSVGDVQMDPLCAPLPNKPETCAMSYNMDRSGTITENVTDGTSFVCGQVLLEGCANPNLVSHTNFDLYPIDTNTALWSPLAPPWTGNLGWLVWGAVELSQFDTNLLAVRSNLNFFIEGALEFTGAPANLGISGPGFFTVRDPVANTLYATRNGAFQLDGLGHLVTTNGLRVQGLCNSLLTQVGDITIDTAGVPNPALKVTNCYVNANGEIEVSLSDGTDFLRGQILLQAYRNPQGLIPVGNGLYSNVAAALPIYTNGVVGPLQNASAIQSGALEQQPPPPAALQLAPSSGFRLFISDLSFGTVQSSPDLVHWNTIGQVNGSSDLNVAEFFDTAQTNQTFYRLVTPE